MSLNWDESVALCTACSDKTNKRLKLCKSRHFWQCPHCRIVCRSKTPACIVNRKKIAINSDYCYSCKVRWKVTEILAAVLVSIPENWYPLFISATVKFVKQPKLLPKTWHFDIYQRPSSEEAGTQFFRFLTRRPWQESGHMRGSVGSCQGTYTSVMNHGCICPLWSIW